ncbi:MAG: nucleotidyltransferase domain-containing protein [Dehalococcoidia bacterium]
MTNELKEMNPSNNDSAARHLILPVGTQVVTQREIAADAGTRSRPRGALGVIVAAPDSEHPAYRVRFLDGRELSLSRQELAIRKHVQRAWLRQANDAGTDPDLYQYVIFRCIVGSRAYGLDEEGSDTDRRGIYLPPAELQWSLSGVPEQLETDQTQECYWELEKFLSLALKANPNVLECLYTPLVETTTPLAEDLLQMRSIFLSQLIYTTYNGYIMSQFKKMEADLRNRGSLRWKHVMHLIRLLLAGITVVKEGFVPVRVERYRDQLLAIRRGETPWEEINGWRLDLHREFDDAYRHTRLPEHPDFERANRFLIRARESMVSSA